ncbi:hypothetical protein D3C80_1587740 [compost metagenome]
MMGIDDQQHRRLGAWPGDAADLGTPVDQHAQAPAMGVFPLLDAHLAAIRRQPGDILDPDRLIVVTHQEA